MGIIEASITGILAGVFSAIGTYIANVLFIKHAEKVSNKLLKIDDV